MKFEIDTTDKTVRFISSGSFSELAEGLKEILGEKIHEYKILGAHGFFQTVRGEDLLTIIERKRPKADLISKDDPNYISERQKRIMQ